MNVVLYTQSGTLAERVREQLLSDVTVRNTLPEVAESGSVHLVHISSLGKDCLQWARDQKDASAVIALCADQPDISEMLESVEAGCKAYCNSYMQSALYQQMIRLLINGQSWFPPQMLEHTFALAQQALKTKNSQSTPDLGALTQREQDVALAVGDGMSNKQIADRFDISERTVKTHLTSIFKKLELQDRVALVLHLK